MANDLDTNIFEGLWTESGNSNILWDASDFIWFNSGLANSCSYSLVRLHYLFWRLEVLIVIVELPLLCCYCVLSSRFSPERVIGETWSPQPIYHGTATHYGLWYDYCRNVAIGHGGLRGAGLEKYALYTLRETLTYLFLYNNHIGDCTILRTLSLPHIYCLNVQGPTIHGWAMWSTIRGGYDRLSLWKTQHTMQGALGREDSRNITWVRRPWRLGKLLVLLGSCRG